MPLVVVRLGIKLQCRELYEDTIRVISCTHFLCYWKLEYVQANCEDLQLDAEKIY